MAAGGQSRETWNIHSAQCHEARANEQGSSVRKGMNGGDAAAGDLRRGIERDGYEPIHAKRLISVSRLRVRGQG